jgi:hypothetical protein
VAPFDPRDSVATATLIAQGRLMALPIAPDASPPAGHAVYAERLDLRIGLSFTEVWEVVLRRRFDLLVQRLVIIEGRPAAPASSLQFDLSGALRQHRRDMREASGRQLVIPRGGQGRALGSRSG